MGAIKYGPVIQFLHRLSGRNNYDLSACIQEEIQKLQKESAERIQIIEGELSLARYEGLGVCGDCSWIQISGSKIVGILLLKSYSS